MSGTGDYERLGAFYLGRSYDLDAGEPTGEDILYDAKDLTTHAVCVGMTGSGKTGLCVSLLEEAALDGIPTLAIDPKGDLGNLMLTFPKLRAADFRPWVDESEALRKGLAADAYAAKVAETWRKGLLQWGQEPARIARLRQAADGQGLRQSRHALEQDVAVRQEPDQQPGDHRLLTDEHLPDLLDQIGAELKPLRSLVSIALAHPLPCPCYDRRHTPRRRSEGTSRQRSCTGPPAPRRGAGGM